MIDTAKPSPRKLRIATLHILLLALAGLPFFAWAQSCQVIRSPNIDFGEIRGTATTDTAATVVVSCQGLAPFGNQITACIFPGEGVPGGVAPRRMTNDAGALMNYDLYANPAQTQLLGAFGGSQPVYAISIQAGALGPQQIPFNIYARVPGGQTLPAAYRYEGNPGTSILRYSYGPPLLAPPTAENCRDGTFPLLGGAGQSQFLFGTVSAQVPSACLITIATDLDFGSASRLDAPRDQSSLIRLRCATGTAWTMTLSNGNNPANGQRRMASNGNFLPYELYLDPALLIPWGDSEATGASDVGENEDVAFPVYGRVFPQPAPIPGSYSDTITVTLTY